MEHVKHKFADFSHADSATITSEQTADTLIKQIPVLGSIYSGEENLSNLLYKAFPSVFKDSTTLSALVANKLNNAVLAKVGGQPYFVMAFKDPKFIYPVTVGPGFMPMDALTLPVYNTFVTKFGMIAGVATIPDKTANPPGYYLFPNVLKSYLQSLGITDSGSISKDVKEVAAVTPGLQQAAPAPVTTASSGLTTSEMVLIAVGIIIVFIFLTK